jgi:hypothetical protein
MTKEKIKELVASIEIGTPATGGCWTDTYPFVVVRKTPQKLFVREVEHGKNRDQWPSQDFEVYLDRPIGPEIAVSVSSKGGWRGTNGFKFGFGAARFYQDPGF